MSELYAIVLAGGSGTRLWPMSRQAYPKQLLSFGGEWSLFQDTVTRISGRVDPGRMIFLTSRELEGDIKDQLRRTLGGESTRCTIVGEPSGRNTGPAILLGAKLIHARDPEALILVVPSDHLIQSTDSFLDALDRSLEAAASGMIVTYGISPTKAETGYGYIKAGKQDGSVHRVERFEEKPTPERARELVSDGSYSWNSGIFLFSARTILEEAGKYLPEALEAIEEVDTETLEGLPEAYERIGSISIDHGIMEKTSCAAVMAVSMGWSDLGSWDSFYETRPMDPSGNVVDGDVLSLDNRGCLLLGGGGFLAATGLTDTIVVQSEDATLICPRGRSQDVRHVVDQLKKQRRSESLVHPTVKRSWGMYKVLIESEFYKVKRLTVEPGQRMSLQLHHRRSEHWVVVTGEVIVTRGEERFELNPNEGTTIPIGTVHRIENLTDAPAELVEVQLGDYLGEDDIVRYEDDYGRETQPPDRRP